MPEIEDPKEAGFEEANTQLAEGLKTCRSIMNSYRAMIGGEAESGLSESTSNLPQADD